MSRSGQGVSGLRAGQLSFAVICLAAAAAPVRAEVPPHLASMARMLVTQSAGVFAAVDPDTPEGWAETTLEQTIRSAGVQRWSARNLPEWTGQEALNKALAADSETPVDAAALVTAARKTGLRQAVADYLDDSGQEVPPDSALARVTADVGAALVSGYQDLARSYVLEGTEGPDLELDWTPEAGLFRLQIAPPGDAYTEPFLTALSGSVLPAVEGSEDLITGTVAEGDQPQDGRAATALMLLPLPDPLKTLDAEDLREIRRSVFGEWAADDGAIWYIHPTGSRTSEPDTDETPQENKTASALQRLNAALAELESLQGDKRYVWVNTETGERDEQEKFRRKKDPWDYAGEELSGAGTPDEINALTAEISRLKATLEQRGEVQQPPELDEPTADGRVVALDLSYTRTDGSLARFNQARLAGNSLTGTRTLREAADITDLPATVVSQLISGWSPPEWVEFELEVDETGNLYVTGSVFRLHVTYNADTRVVSSIHTAYARPVRLTRDPDKKAP